MATAAGLQQLAGPVIVNTCPDCRAIMSFAVPGGIGTSFVCRCDVGERSIRRWRLGEDLGFRSSVEPRGAMARRMGRTL